MCKEGGSSSLSWTKEVQMISLLIVLGRVTFLIPMRHPVSPDWIGPFQLLVDVKELSLVHGCNVY